jgi:predicted RND superfamily exporter protein
MQRLIHTIMNNSLSIVLFTLFVICISAQSLAGWRVQNETLAAHAQSLISYRHFLSTGAFWEQLLGQS